jgi:dihydroneopterin aldolase/2-amino-4-hydroxy-6-hydroxymethyldihydropteridine diphosphokinase
MDEVLLKGLRFDGRHGTTAEERAHPQTFEVDLVLYLDLRKAGATDCLEMTADYSLVYQEVRQIVEEESFNLLEALAERIAGRVLAFNRVVRASVTVKKLHPPISGQYEYFAVRLERERPQHLAFIGLGTNLGNREENLALARQKITALPHTDVTKFSSVYSTLPWGRTEQPEFLNQVVSIDTRLTPRELLEELLDIEKDMGRERIECWGPRIIDLDLLLYGDQVIKEPDLVVPHPWLTKRAFVLTPLLEIAPGLKMPDGRYIREILANLPQ